MSSEDVLKHIQYCEECQETEALIEHAKSEEQFYKLLDKIEQCWVNSYGAEPEPEDCCEGLTANYES